MRSPQPLWFRALIAVLAVACGGSGDSAARPTMPAETGGQDQPATGSEDPQLSGFVATAEVHRDDLDGMAQRRVIRMLTTFNRTSYFLDGGLPRGATAEGARLFEEFINERLGTGRLKVFVAVIPVTRGELLPALEAGRGDIASANLTITEARRERVDFGDPFLTGVGEVIVTGAGAPRLDSLEDLAGQEIWARPSSSFHESLSDLSERLVEAGGKPIDIHPANELLETEDLLQMASSGMIQMTVADSHMAEFWGGVLDGIEVRNDLALTEDRSIAWALRKNTPKLAALVNDFVRKHKKGTLLGNVILKRYFKDNEWVRNPMKEQDRFERLRGNFERWAGEYQMNWVLSAAQGYQESQLDQSKRSSAGAIGVMQMKPSTAADPNVAIPDISEADANIHAGIKYLRFLRDRYYSEEGMTALNQDLFALAAYNAGPARLNRLRRGAAERGLDPNVWFRQVEQLAPRETVQYVGNVFKYYVAYSEYLRQQELK